MIKKVSHQLWEEKRSIEKLLCPTISIVTLTNKPFYGLPKANSLFPELETAVPKHRLSLVFPTFEQTMMTYQATSSPFLRFPKLGSTAYLAACPMHLYPLAGGE